ncbi:hypothetical protein ACH5AI_40605 [Streptomyces collinus]|uniref:hypothetical protein n=1 Tax=Streptomyces collinus TaxID=42684 RepID=UPI0037B787A4
MVEKLLGRIDGAAFSRALLDHLQQLSASRRRVRWVTGWAIKRPGQQANALLPEKVWTAALRQDGKVHEIKGLDGDMRCYQVVELTGLRDLTGWPTGMRLIVRRLKPSRRDAKQGKPSRNTPAGATRVSPRTSPEPGSFSSTTSPNSSPTSRKQST